MAASNWRDNAELVGLFAIVLSIVLLGVEVRQTRLAIVGETYLARTVMVNDYEWEYANSEYLPQIDLKYLGGGLDALTPEERLRLQTDASAAKVRFDGLIFQSEKGLLDEEYLEHVLVPAMQYWIPRWEDLDMLSDKRTRPAFRAFAAVAKSQKR